MRTDILTILLLICTVTGLILLGACGGGTGVTTAPAQTSLSPVATTTAVPATSVQTVSSTPDATTWTQAATTPPVPSITATSAAITTTPASTTATAVQTSFAKPAFTTATQTSVEEKMGLHTSQALGEKKFILVLADFPDVKRQNQVSQIKDRITGFVPNYFSAASYRQMQIKMNIAGPYTLPHPSSYYKISSRNLEVDPTKVSTLVKDVADAADAEVDFSAYEIMIISLGSTTEDYGMTGLCAIPGMLGFEITSVTNKSGEIIRNAAIFCENAHMGTYVHDTLHMLGGRIGKQRMTPCLYDHELQAKYPFMPEFVNSFINMGFWDPLSSHLPADYKMPPAGLSSWTKMRLGWIEPAKIALVKPGQTATVKLDPLSDQSAATLVIKIPLTPTTFYLVENRQKIDSDANCPEAGVLVLYCDDAIYECHNGRAPVKIRDADPGIPNLNGAAFNTGKNNKYVDAANKMAIILQEKAGQSYQVLITTPDKAQ